MIVDMKQIIDKMNKSQDIISFIESKGFVRDIEDNVWYSKDYVERVVPQYHCQHPYSIFYKNGFQNGIRFTTLTELKVLFKCKSNNLT